MIVLRVVAVCFVSCMMLASAEVNAQDKADQLRTIERARLRSLVDADVATARRLHADNFELINPVGGTLTKEQYLKDVASRELDYLEWEPGEIRVRLYGSAAVIRYQANLRVSVKGSAGRAVTFLPRIFTKTETASGKLSGRMRPRSNSDKVPCGSAPRTTACT